ncbi:hypothetical protein A2130_00100 [Candidatus Woesebacteria bacterium GWC2_33_12]|nr:MAG: hypothetical protein A2130_00100 [Candidatus Woesebacteria bacterium GWC2_33_12]OGM78693.1 MAG: hypothetical protein A2366_03460 [Candidatus Woesebacteria bacterium RIFOXYB1_FULL_33_9]OGM87525.1 MAG: hypothetical protein A2616_03395 [Candidatus Woesebacteria bacterium RIFOXYD1_FULL_33_11]HCR35912.1 hypothetical protein [Candidatus Woesebacteria bacterium]
MTNNIWFLIASDLLINLAAGWLGAVLIVPNFSSKNKRQKLVVLTMDIVFAIFCILGAYKFRSL